MPGFPGRNQREVPPRMPPRIGKRGIAPREEEPEEGSRLVRLPPGQIYKPTLESLQGPMRKANSVRKNLWKTQLGPNNIRVMPPFSKANRIAAAVEWHWGVSPDEKLGCMCLEYVEMDCFVCEMREAAASSRNAEDHKRSDRMSKKIRILLNINDLADVDGGIQVFNCNDSFYREIVGFWSSDYGDVTDPEEGFNLTFTGTKGNNNMVNTGDPRPERNPSPIAYAKWRDELKDLDNYFRIPSREYQQDLYDGKIKSNWG